MSSELSLSQILSNLETQIGQHREREAFHAGQEVYHREQRAREAEELAAVLQSYDALMAVAGTAAEIAARVAPPAPPPREEPPGKTKLRGRLVERLVADLPADEVFGPTRIATELNRRHGRALSRAADSRFTSSALRRLRAEGSLRLVQKGTPHHEAMYRKA